MLQGRSDWLRHATQAVQNVIVILMGKGGAGKTTLSLLLADALARFGLSVLVIDMDPQGNSSIGLGNKVQLVEDGVAPGGGRPIFVPQALTVCEVIESGEPGIAEEAIALASAAWQHPPTEPFTRGGPLFRGLPGTVGVIPCYKKLNVDASKWRPGDVGRLRTALLHPATSGATAPHIRWDLVLIDTPPGGSLISVQAAMAAHKALFVSPPATFGALAIPETTEFVQDVRDHYGHPGLDVIGLILNEFVSGARRTQTSIIRQLEQAHDDGLPLFQAPMWDRIPDYTVVPEAQSYPAPVSYLLGNSGSREPARKVCQAAEANAIRLLQAIGHPASEKIAAAWEVAWNEEATSATAPSSSGKRGRHRRVR